LHRSDWTRISRSAKLNRCARKLDCRSKSPRCTARFCVHRLPIVAPENLRLVRNCLRHPAKRLHRSHRDQRRTRSPRSQRSRGRGGRSRPRQRLSPGRHPHPDDALRPLRLAHESFCNLENPQPAQQTRIAMASKTCHCKKTNFRAPANRPLDPHLSPVGRRMDLPPHDPPRTVVEAANSALTCTL